MKAPDARSRWIAAGVCFFLAMATWLVFGQTLRFGFVNFDDPAYLLENSLVQKGVTWEGVRWALTYGEIGHWHPLTWLSHMLDCQLYGLNAFGHHLTNVLIHTATSILLFLVLRSMTACPWRSAFVAAVFAIHPLRAESVAWISERKDVLGAFFFVLTLGAYARYVRRPSKPRYTALVVIFAFGLLAKNMLVTTPFVLLLLDYWPLNRLSNFSLGTLGRRVVEKLPLFALTVASCVATALVPEKVAAENLMPLTLRLENAVVSYVVYLWQTIHPVGLAVHYPNPLAPLPIGQVGAALGLLVILSEAAWLLRRTHPYLIVGWLWFLGMMIPVIGIVQISHYAHADRYTYLPGIGLSLALTWAAADAFAVGRRRRFALAALSAIMIAVLTIFARTQTSFWRNSETLWAHAVACSPRDPIAQVNLGNALLENQRADEAIPHYEAALAINPRDEKAHYNLANALVLKGRIDDALPHYVRALQLRPDDADAHVSFGYALIQKGDPQAAMAHLQTALKIQPDHAEAHNNLGFILLQRGSVQEAIGHFQKAVQIQPDHVEARFNLANGLLREGRTGDAISSYEDVLQRKPDYAEAHYNLANTLLQTGKVDAAVGHYQKVLELKPDHADAAVNLGNAFIQKGNLDNAITQYRKALEIRPDYAEAAYNLGNILLRKGDLASAIGQYQRALQIRPDYLNAHYTLGCVLLQNGRAAAAIPHFQKALELKPGWAEAEYNLGLSLIQDKNPEEALGHYRRALQLQPDDPDTLNNLAWELATSPRASLRNGRQAVALAQRANQLAGGEDLDILGTLAAAHAEAGQFDEAVTAAAKAVRLARSTAQSGQLPSLEDQLKLYEARRPFHREGE